MIVEFLRSTLHLIQNLSYYRDPAEFFRPVHVFLCTLLPPVKHDQTHMFNFCTSILMFILIKFHHAIDL